MATPRTVPVWQQRWFQFMLAVLLVLLVGMFVIPPLFALLYAARTVLVPVVVALALAYAVNPLVTWLRRRAKLPRPITAVLIMLTFVVVMLGLFAYLTPILISQVEQLIVSGAEYADDLSERIDMTKLSELKGRVWEAMPATLTGEIEPDASGQSLQLPAIDFSAVGRALLSALDVGYGVVSGAIGLMTYLSLFAVILAFCFFFFVWKFQAVLDFFVPFIPADHRPRTLEVLKMMDRTVAGFIRGRLIQAAVMATTLSVGWAIVDVQYWLLLGLAGGVLNLIPYAGVIVWPVAVLLAYLESLSGGGFSWLWVVILPSVVYFVAQTLDGWVVEPLVQGQATDLDPLTVLLCVLIGGSLLGLLGMLIAIPATACIKILLREVVLPKLRELAAQKRAA